MKTKIITSTLFALFFGTATFAQDRTTVNATNSEISDNLDLRAVASIFGDAENLEDFERRLNDPKIQISNLDLNDDNQVDYLRVIESVEGDTHLVIVQAVLGQDVFQDVATIEVERDQHNKVQVQVVGDVYMYGDNFIYEPVYVHTPWFYTSFWSIGYHPYASLWYWNYYPTYYYGWNPYPVFRYRNNCYANINIYNTYNYVSVRRSERARTIYNGRRQNYYERQNPTRSFAQRNTTVRNRYELNETRGTRNGVTRNNLAYNTPRPTGSVRNADSASPRTNAGTRNNPGTRNDAAPRTNAGTRTNPGTRNDAPPRTNAGGTRNNPGTRSDAAPRTNTNIRSNSGTGNESSPRTNTNIRTNSNSENQNSAPRANTNIRTNSGSESQNSSPRDNGAVRASQNQSMQNSTPRSNTNVRSSNENAAPRSAPQMRSEQPRQNTQRSAPQNQSQQRSAPAQSQGGNPGGGNGNGGGRGGDRR